MSEWFLPAAIACSVGFAVFCLAALLDDYDPEARYGYSYERFLRETPWCPGDGVTAHEIALTRGWSEPEDAQAARDALDNHGFTNLSQRVSGDYDVIRGECPAVAA